MTEKNSRPWQRAANVNRDGDNASLAVPSDKSVAVWFAEAVAEVNQDRGRVPSSGV